MSRDFARGTFLTLRRHLQNGIKVVKYHGENRPKTVKELEDSDIVVTTYHTLTAEYLAGKGKNSPLYQLGWYRIVLDEGESSICSAYRDT